MLKKQKIMLKWGSNEMAMKRSTIISILALAIIAMILVVLTLRFGEEVRLQVPPVSPVPPATELPEAEEKVAAPEVQMPAPVEELPKVVEITSTGFTPTVIRVKAGEQLTFINRDTELHWPIMIRGESCLNAKCSTLASLYQGSEKCDKMCNFYSLVITTSDGESYTVRPRRGSYSCAGALEWKVAGDMPDHCIGEKAIVPLRIIMKEPKRILSEEIITLQKGESRTATHPTIPGCTLTLSMEDVFELCT